jgi:DNA-directed RNA polymerase subunit RPC12/RpoP
MFFKKNDDSFVCENCGNPVPRLEYTSRDHCPVCLYSKHVDVYPGDRQETCCGLLEPIGVQKTKKGTQIIYKCTKCSAIRKNITAADDNMDMIIKLSSNPIIC